MSSFIRVPRTKYKIYQGKLTLSFYICYNFNILYAREKTRQNIIFYEKKKNNEYEIFKMKCYCRWVCKNYVITHRRATVMLRLW